MSRYVRVNDTDYKVTVESGGTITFDTGTQDGRVVVTGDLVVEGNTTTVESETLTVKDNIIIVNDGETGNGVTLGSAGLRIDRGIKPIDLPTYPSPQPQYTEFVYDETIEWLSPVNPLGSIGNARTGAFALRDNFGDLVGLQTNSISTAGGDLFLINQGTGVISVTGTVDYENQVLDDDDIPNRRYVENRIEYLISILPAPFEDRIVENDTFLVVNDFEEDGNPSGLRLFIDNILNFEVQQNLFEVQGVQVSSAVISSVGTNTNLTIAANGIGSVIVDDTLKLLSTGSIPVSELDGAKIYSTGVSELNDTGVYFVNADNFRDEFASRRRALAYSYIF